MSHINLLIFKFVWVEERQRLTVRYLWVKVVIKTQKSSRFWFSSLGSRRLQFPADDNVIKWLWFTVHNSSTSSHWLRHSHHTSSLASCFGNSRAGYQNHCTDGLHCGFAFIAIMAIRGCCWTFLILVVKPYTEPRCWPRFKQCFTAKHAS